MNILDIFNSIIKRMESMVSNALDDDLEERAFTESEQAEFNALEAAAKAIKPIAKQAPDDTDDIRAVFEKR